jgi:hypothetical protein
MEGRYGYKTRCGLKVPKKQAALTITVAFCPKESLNAALDHCRVFDGSDAGASAGNSGCPG